MCTKEETLKTTTSITLTKLSIFIAQCELNAPDVIHSKITSEPFSTGNISRKTAQLASPAITTIAVAIIIATFSPIDRCNSPAITDPKRGPKIKNSTKLNPS